MKTSLKTFLDDLYEIDPSLQSHEVEIIPLVEKLMQSDPAAEPDTEFVKRLRMQLKERAADLSTPQSAGFQKWLFALGGAVFAAVIIPVAFVAMDQMKSGTPAASDSSALFSYSVTDAGKDAFGPLSGLSADDTIGRGGGGGDAEGGQGGEGDGMRMPDVAPPLPMAQEGTIMTTDMGMGGDAKMIAPYPMVKYEYVYDGPLPELLPMVAVYKHIPHRDSLPFSALGAMNLGSIDVSSFAGLSIDTINFSQNKPYGYQITVNLRDSSVILDAQWDQWPMSQCRTDACFQAERVKLTDIPADDQLISIAKDFVSNHDVDVSHYGEPEVDTQWKRYYDYAPNKADAWLPDQLRVVYPLMIDGHKVSDQSGMPFGISVGVHIKSRRVMNVYGLMSRDFAKSDYAGVSDSKQITDYLARLDNYAWMPESELKDVKTATVILGEPTVGYSVYYTYKDNLNQELLIPVLTFPVTNVTGDDQFFYRNNVVVPLAAEMLTEQMNGGQPMPIDGVRAM